MTVRNATKKVLLMILFSFQLRDAQNRLEELETTNSHLIKRFDKLKNARSTLLKDLSQDPAWGAGRTCSLSSQGPPTSPPANLQLVGHDDTQNLLGKLDEVPGWIVLMDYSVWYNVTRNVGVDCILGEEKNKKTVLSHSLSLLFFCFFIIISVMEIWYYLVMRLFRNYDNKS